MNPRLLAIFITIISLPLVVMTVLMVNYWQDQEAMNQVREKALIQQQLKGVDQSIKSVLKDHERSILQQQLTNLDPWILRDVVQKHVTIDHLLVLAPDQSRVFPPADLPLSERETLFIERTALFREDMGEKQPAIEKIKPSRTNSSKKQQRSIFSSPISLDQEVVNNGQGWYVWYWQSGVHLIYWWRDERGYQFGVEVSRVKLLSDIVAMLPLDESPLYRITLLDSAQQLVYQWGGLAESDASQVEELSLSFPLSAWTVQYFQAERSGQVAEFLPGFFALLVGGVLVLVLALYFYRESSRESREARQRVTFVNQVSHELKTPLTNIRLYAELLEQSLDDEDESHKRKLNIIIAEAQRLSRMIGNVLTFARQARHKCRFQPSMVVLDEIVQEVVDQFELSYAASHIQMKVELVASTACMLDRDIIEQVLGNLLSNVEKYAASGGFVEIVTIQQDDQVGFRVADAGPGIPKSLRKQVFEPFVRGQNKLTEGVSGTGIGLSIAQDLVQLHQGSIRLLPSDSGAVFEVLLPMRTQS